MWLGCAEILLCVRGLTSVVQLGLYLLRLEHLNCGVRWGID
jgi:hypothetical protein